jgi:hypothetical protein
MAGLPELAVGAGRQAIGSCDHTRTTVEPDRLFAVDCLFGGCKGAWAVSPFHCDDGGDTQLDLPGVLGQMGGCVAGHVAGLTEHC